MEFIVWPQPVSRGFLLQLRFGCHSGDAFASIEWLLARFYLFTSRLESPHHSYDLPSTEH